MDRRTAHQRQVEKRVDVGSVSPEGGHFKREFKTPQDKSEKVEEAIKTAVQNQGMIGLMDLVIENKEVKGYLGEDPIEKLEELMDFSDVEKAVILPSVDKILSGDLWKLKDINTDNWDACKNNDKVKELMGRSLKGQFLQLIAKLPIPLFKNVALDFCKGLVPDEITKVKETLGVNQLVMPQASGSVESRNISGQGRRASVSRLGEIAKRGQCQEEEHAVELEKKTP